MSAQTVQEISTYLTFGLGEETFAMDVANVREVLDVIDVTKVPRTPDYMLGVINLRGGVVPVVDMRIKFGLPATEKSVDTCIVVTEVDLDGESTVIGALADSVQEVFEMAANEIEPPPSLGMRLDTEFVKGMGKREDQFIIILDVNRIFSTEELIEFQGTNEEVLSAETAEDDETAQ
jgi:purine-binding chemotaxis protein CheW